MKTKIKLKGQLRNYMYWPLILTIVLAVINVPAYFINLKLGALFSAFVVIYFLFVLFAYFYNKPVILNELINFATQYGTVQKRLLDEFQVAYALLDYSGKILWCNKQFEVLSGKDKNYHKSITSIFPALTREVLKRDREIIEVDVTFQNRYYRASMNKIYFDTVTDNNESSEFHDTAAFYGFGYAVDCDNLFLQFLLGFVFKSSQSKPSSVRNSARHREHRQPALLLYRGRYSRRGQIRRR